MATYSQSNTVTLTNDDLGKPFMLAQAIMPVLPEIPQNVNKVTVIYPNGEHHTAKLDLYRNSSTKRALRKATVSAHMVLPR